MVCHAGDGRQHTWQTMPANQAKDEFDAATDLFYIAA